MDVFVLFFVVVECPMDPNDNEQRAAKRQNTIIKIGITG
jgi:hypothetical protein